MGSHGRKCKDPWVREGEGTRALGSAFPLLKLLLRGVVLKCCVCACVLDAQMVGEGERTPTVYNAGDATPPQRIALRNHICANAETIWRAQT